MEMLERLLLSIEKVLLWIATAAMVTIVVLTTCDALGRYLFNLPIFFAFEVTERYLLIAGVFLAFSFAYRNDVFIRVGFFIEMMPAPVKMFFDHVAQIVTAGYCLFFAYSSLEQSLNGLAEGATMSSVPIPLAPSYFAVPIGFAMLAVLVIYDMAKVKRGKSRLMPPQVEGDTGQSAT
jgi:TRAP-type transport system small permease protein